MDKLKHIRNLLEQFYAGSTSLEQEEELKAFFESNAVPDDLASDREMFISMAMLSMPVDIPSDLNENLIEAIDKAEKQDKRVRRISLYSLSGLAAGLLIILSVYLGIIKFDSSDILAHYTVEDPQIAYMEAMKAFEIIGSKWNSGTEELQSLDNLSKGMQSVRPLQKISSGARQLNLLGNLEKANDIQIQ